MKRTISALVLAASLLGAPSAAFGQQALNLQMADIRAFIEDVARVTGRTFIIDPRVQGNVTISSNAAIGRDELLDVLFSALRANGLIAVPIGALVAIPSIRLSGLFLALATLGFGLLVERVFYRRSYMFTVLAEGRRTPRPGWAAAPCATG